MTLVYLLAGEHSGDVLGARLMAALQAARPGLRIRRHRRPAHGGAGPAQPVPDAGTGGDGPAGGAAAAARACAACWRRPWPTSRARRPDVLVTIDSPGFTLRLLRRVARAAASRGCITSPRRSGRGGRAGCASSPDCGSGCSACCRSSRRSSPATACRRASSAIRCWSPARMPATPGGSAPRTASRRTRAVLVLMPGSRRSEAPRLLPVYGATLALLARRFPTLVPVVPVASAVAETVAAATATWRGAAGDRDRGGRQARRLCRRRGGADQVRHLDAGTGAGRACRWR